MKRTATKPTKLKIADLQADERLRVRESIDPKITGDYFDGMLDGLTNVDDCPFPPIDVRRIEDALYVVDGWRRIKAAEQRGMSEIHCHIIDATWPEAIIAAAAANANHGVPLTASERRRAVQMVLCADEGQSDRSVADLIGVSPSTVSKVRDELADAGDIENGGERIGADGKKYTVNQRSDPRGETPRQLNGSDQQEALRISGINGSNHQVSNLDTWNPIQLAELTDINELTGLTELHEPSEPDEPAEVQIIVARFRASIHREEILAGIVEALNEGETQMVWAMLKSRMVRLSNKEGRYKSKKVNPAAV